MLIKHRKRIKISINEEKCIKIIFKLKRIEMLINEEIRTKHHQHKKRII